MAKFPRGNLKEPRQVQHRSCESARPSGYSFKEQRNNLAKTNHRLDSPYAGLLISRCPRNRRIEDAPRSDSDRPAGWLVSTWKLLEASRSDFASSVTCRAVWTWLVDLLHLGDTRTSQRVGCLWLRPHRNRFEIAVSTWKQPAMQRLVGCLGQLCS